MVLVTNEVPISDLLMTPRLKAKTKSHSHGHGHHQEDDTKSTLTSSTIFSSQALLHKKVETNLM